MDGGAFPLKAHIHNLQVLLDPVLLLDAQVVAVARLVCQLRPFLGGRNLASYPYPVDIQA